MDYLLHIAVQYPVFFNSFSINNGRFLCNGNALTLFLDGLYLRLIALKLV